MNSNLEHTFLSLNLKKVTTRTTKPTNQLKKPQPTQEHLRITFYGKKKYIYLRQDGSISSLQWHKIISKISHNAKFMSNSDMNYLQTVMLDCQISEETMLVSCLLDWYRTNNWNFSCICDIDLKCIPPQETKSQKSQLSNNSLWFWNHFWIFGKVCS